MLYLNKNPYLTLNFKWTKIASIVVSKDKIELITGMMTIHSTLKEMLNKMKTTKDLTHLNRQNINLQKIRKKESSRKKKSHPKDSKNHVAK